jgi:hypothetical protein
MFIGHFAVGYAAKRWAPQLSLATLFAAALFADLLWPVLVAAGIERVRIAPGTTASTPLEFISYPYSHALTSLLLWGTAFGWLCARRYRHTRLFVIVLALVVSHWGLDVVTHIPDVPLYPGGPRYGLGLWNSVAGTFLVEIVMFAIGVAIYTRATNARDGIGKWAFIGLTAFLLVGFIVNAGASDSPPPSVTALWMMAIALGAVTLVLAWWSDAHRVPA